MRHLVSIVLIVGALAAFAASLGPLYFGALVIAVALLVAAVCFEAMFWRRVVQKRR